MERVLEKPTATIPRGRGGRGRGAGRGLQKGWVDFKPKPVSITKEEILAAEKFQNQFVDADEKSVSSLSEQLSAHKLNNNNINHNKNISGQKDSSRKVIDDDEKPPLQVADEEKKPVVVDSVLLKAVNAREFTPAYAVAAPPRPGGGNEPENYFLHGDTGDEIAHTVLMNSVLTLTVKPEEFDESIIVLANVLMEHVKTEVSLTEVIRIIIEQSMSEVNFSYAAARMCHYFDERKVFHQIQSSDGEKIVTFRTVFFKKCQGLFESATTNAKKHSKSATDFQNLSNTAIFFGELFCHMKLKNQVNPLYRSALLTLVRLFLESKDEPLIKCLTRLLKMIGPELDNEVLKENQKKEVSREINKIFDNVREFSFDEKLSGHLSDNTKEGIRKVYRLRSRNWDRGSPPSSPLDHPALPEFPPRKGSNPSTRKGSSSSTIDWNDFYAGDDGDVYSNYMQGDMDPVYFNAGSYEPELTSEDDEDAAYEEFLRMSGQV